MAVMRRLYCTAGAGMEELLVEEVKHKLRATRVEKITGRVFFWTNADLQTVSQLKSAERLFLLLLKAEHIPLPSNPAKAAGVIQQRVVGDPDIWRQAFLTWKELQVDFQDSQQHGQKRKREEDEKETDSSTLFETQSERGNEMSEETPSFRVNCRCSGVIARSFTSQRLSRIIGMAIREQLQWKVDLKQPVLEVNVYLSDDHCVAGFPLLKRPLANRSYMKHSGLRSTVAWAMTSFCPKSPNGSVVLDPMCGVGAVLLEAAQEFSNAVLLGMDTDCFQLQKAAENIKASGMEGRVQLLQSSAMEIPLPDETVDILLCDVPFGRKFTCKTDMSTALPCLLQEMTRVLRVGGHLCLLLSLQLSVQFKKMICTEEHNPSSLHAQNNPADPLKSTNKCADSKDLLCKTRCDAVNQSKICCLLAEQTHKVSLGSTDAFIHTYSKILKYRESQTLAHNNVNSF